MTLQKQNVSEVDIIKSVTLKRQFESLYTSLASKEKADQAYDLSSKDQKTERKNLVKQAMKVWLAVGKFVRSQANKDKVVDTLFFGTFAKASTVQSKGKESY